MPDINEKVLNKFVYQVFEKLYKSDCFASIIPFMKKNEKSGYHYFDDGDISMTSLFVESNLEDVNARNKQKGHQDVWFTNAFDVNGKQWFLTTQWNGPEESQSRDGRVYSLCIPRLNKLVEKYYGLSIHEPHYWTLEKSSLELLSRTSFEKNILQKIFFGAPGTGKSHKIDAPVAEGGLGLKDVPENRKFRTTFHPDYDYAQFVGCYKPRTNTKLIDKNVYSLNELSDILKKKYDAADAGDKTVAINMFGFDYATSMRLSNVNANQISNTVFGSTSKQFAQINAGIRLFDKLKDRLKGGITYSFSPQVFANAYVAAWCEYLTAEKKDKANQVFLVIEEINRGNCAQIFGDIFQLLDRKNGWSEYPVDVDNDFASYVRDEIKKFGKFAEYRKAICDCMEDASETSALSDDEFCKIVLPPNFNILATMNTSDQSLFPMDSAFKRRFDWEYIPIKYEEKIDDKETPWNFKINLGDQTVEWPRFLRRINANIYKVTQCEDKQMGEFFIKPKKDGEYIDWKDFRSKVLFYLWDSIYKDESENSDAKVIFHYKSQTESYKDRNVTFQSFFESDEVAKALINEICENLNKVYEKDSSFGKKIFE